MDQQKWTCPQCSRMISPDDTFVFGHGLLGHLDCRRPRVLSAEERSLLFLYCWDHKAAECSSCLGQFLLREVVAMDRFGVRLHVCPRCHADLTSDDRARRYHRVGPRPPGPPRLSASSGSERRGASASLHLLSGSLSR